eukprot:gnl/TRDRNA2_/TRDRNA2_42447_c0_seq1.p1 gnl/TRDRNA2_/TRDRNA2_42447_c0~~gnl/TRDRNA2_/TRDRNA2_42447_c0_seq1.p1  ORF type:complete len:166 (+),score=18.13 gnl/TRDRNA2_/TRDRNA2_42447_c0_seq1:74-499(+)
MPVAAMTCTVLSRCIAVRRPFRFPLPSCIWASSAPMVRHCAGVTGQCTTEEIERRDAERELDRKAYQKCRDAEESLGPPFNRKIFVANFRSQDGSRRVPKIQINDSTDRKIMTITEKDFEEIVKNLPKIKTELIRYGKKLT